ncbi:hypothetical protein PNP85_05100 [Halobacterium salinarum]|uniref:hypothetical protein n=1 Tax=Halobacterium salinarum TaxID=2242 RepID=UPI0025535E07|nr:hypothetical protein [Halobacterium salinarum]MDL0138877.1 hypothetical protein [Halobacterium salinarum]
MDIETARYTARMFGRQPSELGGIELLAIGIRDSNSPLTFFKHFVFSEAEDLVEHTNAEEDILEEMKKRW